ncbi:MULTISPECIES: toprim domain-containing protein [Vibrio]|nr:toprim domain-containing protein [Vibrio tasmaniensis]PMO89915.1 hypothetical protein BCT01_01125 [Vibrio tasmaniensis]PMP17782.1 hypothetical protein BCS92_05080 [Vibrio tasmaniensis]
MTDYVIVNKNTSNVALKLPILTALKLTSEYYQYHFKNRAPDGINYIKSRGFNEETIDKFQLGYSPSSFTQLLAQSKNAVWRDKVKKSIGYSLNDDELTETIKVLLELGGVVKSNEKGSFDRFKGRVIFPIFDLDNNIVSFGGRKINDEAYGPKYLNGSDSPVFHKNEVIFGEHLLNRLQKVDRVLVTEGYMDVATLHQFRYETAVATMGTSINENQIERLFQYTDCLHFCFDGDEAGIKASKRAVKQSRAALSGNRKIVITILPDGEDPDSILRSEDTVDEARDAFNIHLNNSISIENYLLNLTLDELNLKWGQDNQYVFASLLNDVVKMPTDSMIANKIKQFIKIESHRSAQEFENINSLELVQSFR